MKSLISILIMLGVISLPSCSAFDILVGNPPPTAPNHGVTITRAVVADNGMATVDVAFTGPPNTTAEGGIALKGAVMRHMPMVIVDLDENGQAQHTFSLLEGAGVGVEVVAGITPDNFNTLTTTTQDLESPE